MRLGVQIACTNVQWAPPVLRVEFLCRCTHAFSERLRAQYALQGPVPSVSVDAVAPVDACSDLLGRLRLRLQRARAVASERVSSSDEVQPVVANPFPAIQYVKLCE